MPAYKDQKTGTRFCKFYYTDYTGAQKQKKKRGFKFQREGKGRIPYPVLYRAAYRGTACLGIWGH